MKFPQSCQLQGKDIVRLIDSPEFSAEIIHILRRNNEAITENSNGYFFEFAKVKDSTMQELLSLIEKFDYPC